MARYEEVDEPIKSRESLVDRVTTLEKLQRGQADMLDESRKQIEWLGEQIRRELGL